LSRSQYGDSSFCVEKSRYFANRGQKLESVFICLTDAYVLSYTVYKKGGDTMKKVLAGILVLFIAGVCFLNILGDGQPGQKERHYIVLGDGRAGELIPFAHKEDHIEFITKSGADLEWLDREALPELIESDRRFSCVIVMTGISDMHNADKYVTALNDWGKRLKDERGADLYMNSVNPVTAGVFDPADVDEFNRTVKEGLDPQIQFIDTGTLLREAGFTTTDTLHYTEETSKRLYEFLIEEIEKLQII